MKKTVAEKLSSRPIEDVVKQSKGALMKDVSQLKRSYRRRAASLKKSGLYSYALEGMEASKSSYSSHPVSSLTRNQLLHEYARYSTFFNSETSSVRGIKQINMEQDIRLFGATKGGKPIKSMSEDERRRFWELYDEFRNQHPELAGRSYSEYAQQTIAEANFMGDDVLDDISSFLEDTASRMREKVRAYGVSGPNVLMGRRSDIEK